MALRLGSAGVPVVIGSRSAERAAEAEEMVPDGVTVVSALHSVSAASLGDLEHELDEDVLVAGDAAAAKRDVAELIARVPGLRPVNAGRLEMARLIEGITPLLISVN